MGSLAEELLELALTRPEALPGTAVADLAQALAGTQNTLPFAALAAMAYGRPELLTAEVLFPLAEQLRRGALSDVSPELLAATFAHLAHTALAAPALESLLAAATAGDLYLALGERALALFDHYRQHHPELWRVHGALGALDALPSEPDLADGFLGRILEPLLVRDVASLDAALWGRLVSRCASLPRWKYCLSALAERAPLGSPVTEVAHSADVAGRLDAHFPHRRNAAALLRNGPLHVVVLFNVGVGQGDELIRITPLVQSLLDANPEARITLLTPRAHLYDDPRVDVVRLDEPRASAVLLAPCDARFVLNEPAAHGGPLRPDIAALEGLTAAAQRVLAVRGNVANGYFLFQSVRLGERELAGESALDRIDVPSVYDASWRLQAELGLPTRCGSETPRSPSLLVARRSPEALGLWTEIGGGSTLPAAVVQPFGGAHPLKGYVEQHAGDLARGLSGLVEEGYRVVLLPNGTPWGGASALAPALSMLPEPHRREVAIAPDPAAESGLWKDRLAERPELNWADRVMRLHKYFASYAELVVTVEGWLGHLAYQLGRPLRIVLRTQSDTSRWYPPLRSPDQVVTDRLSPRAPVETGELVDGRALPLPGLARHAMLLSAISGLGEVHPARAVPLLLRLVESRDHSLRAAALRALASAAAEPAVRATLLAGLADPENAPRGGAAEALLGAGVDCARELGASYEVQLRAHVAIAHQRWLEVLALGTTAVPAVTRAMTDASPIIRREAKWAMARLLVPVVRRG